MQALRRLDTRQPDFGPLAFPSTEAATPRPRKSPLSGSGARTAVAAGLILAAGLALSKMLAARHATPRRLKLLGSAALAATVAVDSGISHYRGRFFRRLMYLPPPTATLALAAMATGVGDPVRWQGVRTGVSTLALAIGTTGLGFHAYNVGKRPGGFSWGNLFYAAPLEAPGALAFSGLCALSCRSVGLTAPLERSPRLQLVLCAFGIAATVADVALYHFRGAFHNRYMALPLLIPSLGTVAAASMAGSPSRGRGRLCAALLAATGLTGVLGLVFHGYGIHRNMGGWYNASQNVLNGPPIGAPPSFTGLALYGLGALRQLEGLAHG